MNDKPLQNQAALDAAYKTAAIVFGAQIMSAIVIAAVAFFIAPTLNIGPIAVDSKTLWFLLAFVAIGAFLARRALMNWERFRNIAVLKGIGGVLASLRSITIVLGAFGEAVVLIGFVIAALSGEAVDVIRAALIALVLFGVNFPRKNVWRTIVASLEKV